jgi:hypothetical protein
VRLIDADARSEVRGFHEDGIGQTLLNGIQNARGCALPYVAPIDQVVDDGQANVLEDHLHLLFVHAQRRAQHAAAYIGHVRHLQQPL